MTARHRLEWVDATSYSQGEKKGETPPRTFMAKMGHLRLIVTKFIHFGDEWVAHCDPLYSKRPLGTEDFEVAKERALRLYVKEMQPYISGLYVVQDELELIEKGK